jgi:hypothetical protein
MSNVSAIASLGIICLTTTVAGLAGTSDRDYPNELPGYRFHARSAWRSILPLVSREPEVTTQLGPLKASGYTFERQWRLVVSYWGSGGDCDGVPFPSFLTGTVAKIELIPNARVSLLGVQFPDAFEKSNIMVTHDPVGSYDRYKDEHGLEYQVYDANSEDGSIHAGDLRAIVYGPSHRAYMTLTGCEH